MKREDNFEREPLINVFPESLRSLFMKISNAMAGHESQQYGAMHVKMVSDALEAFRKDLEEKGLLEGYPLLEILLNYIAYPLAELFKFFEKPEESKLNCEDASIFRYYIEDQIEYLMSLSKDVNEEYAAVHIFH